MIIWSDRMLNLTKALGRRPALDEMLDCAQIHQMTPAEMEEQRQSWVKAEAKWAKDFREGKCERD